MPRSLRAPCVVAVGVAVLVAVALFAGVPRASACTSRYAGGCENGNPVPSLTGEDEYEYELIGDLPTSGGIALALWSGGPTDALAREAKRRGCVVSALYANDPDGGVTSVALTSSLALPSPSPVLVECAPRLAGRVLDADGEPPGIVRVTMWDAVDPSGPGGVTEARTSADGSFTIVAPRRGDFVIRIDLIGGPIGWYGPGGFTTTERDRATEVTLGRFGAEVEMRLPELTTISGSVHGPDGAPRSKVGSGHVLVQVDNGDISRLGATEVDGSFSVVTPAGKVEVAIAISTHGASSTIGWQDPGGGFTSDRNEAASLLLPSTGAMHRDIRLPTVRWVRGVVLCPAPAGCPQYVRLWARSAGGELWDSLSLTLTDQDGNFEIPVVDGVYALEFYHLDDGDGIWASVAVHDVTGGVTWACGPLVPFEVDGADVTGVEITLPGVAREGDDCH